MEICGVSIKPSFSTSEFDVITQKLRLNNIIIGFIDGHIFSNTIKNPIWVILENTQCYLLLLCCDSEHITKLCIESYSKILTFEKVINNNKKINWNISKNGYIYGSVLKIGVLSMHQVIMNYYKNGTGSGCLSVDHIDRNKLNNTLSNLRIATSEEQNQNRKGIIPGTKLARQHQARELPEGILQEDMPKYVNYNVNVWDKEKNKTRDFFRIERHPLIYPKVWEGTKSMKVSIKDKLEQCKKVLHGLDNGVLPSYSQRELPTHVYFSIIHEQQYLVYDNRNTKHTKKMKIKDESFDINNPEKREKQVYIFNHLIMKTYGEDESVLPEEYEYCGESIDEKELNDLCFQLPKYVCLLNEGGNTILAFNRHVDKKRFNKKIKLSNNYEKIESTPELLDDIQKGLPLLNKAIIKKYGKEYAIIELSEKQTEELIENIKEEQPTGFPMYTRIQAFKNGNYLVFNKNFEKKRLNTTIKLPDNYNKNQELNKLNQKIIELYGEIHKLNLTDYPTESIVKKIQIPKDMCIILNCKTPYLYINKDSITIIHKLPKDYDLQNEIDFFYNNQSLYTPVTNQSYDEYLNSYSIWKPNRISLTIKNKKIAILYKYKTEEFSHYYSMNLPTDEFNIYLYLSYMNSDIIDRYGKEYSIFYVPE